MTATMRDALQHFLDDGHARGLYTAGAVGVSVRGERVLCYAGTLAEDDPEPTTPGTLFDLASVSKSVVAVVAVAVAESGLLDLDAPVTGILGRDRAGQLVGVTPAMLLTHTSGLPAESFVWRDSTIPADHRLQRVIETPLETPPGERFRYSDVGYIVLGAVLEAATGRALPDLISERVAEPLHLDSLRYGPVDPRITAATEEKAWVDRGMVRGEVHDELNWFLGGRAGNAGLFADAPDVLSFAESYLTGALVSSASLRTMTSDMLLPSQRTLHGQGYGPRIDDPAFIGPLHGFGHPGFTGTSWTVYPGIDTAAVLLTNRVHPRRDRVDIAPTRRALGELVAKLATSETA
jgi:CubicO group peptidase (beta-lactamase class C family)